MYVLLCAYFSVLDINMICEFLFMPIHVTALVGDSLVVNYMCCDSFRIYNWDSLSYSEYYNLGVIFSVVICGIVVD